MSNTNLTFSQEYGLEPKPQALKLEELPHSLRNTIWAIIYLQFTHANPFNPGNPRWIEILQAIHTVLLERPIDEFPHIVRGYKEELKEIVYIRPFNKVFDLLQFIMQHPQCNNSLENQIKEAFEFHQAAYSVIKSRFVPRTTEVEGKNLEEVFAQLNNHGIKGAERHLLNAIDELNKRKYAESARESITAVESILRLTADAPNKTLGAALEILSKKVYINPQLKEALIKLYTYTNNEKGIRHSGLEDETKIDQTDAIFMLGTCASFVGYFIGKTKGNKITLD
jgi:phosphopantetheine adenylyltransferase